MATRSSSCIVGIICGIGLILVYAYVCIRSYLNGFPFGGNRQLVLPAFGLTLVILSAYRLKQARVREKAADAEIMRPPSPSAWDRGEPEVALLLFKLFWAPALAMCCAIGALIDPKSFDTIWLWALGLGFLPFVLGTLLGSVRVFRDTRPDMNSRWLTVLAWGLLALAYQVPFVSDGFNFIFAAFLGAGGICALFVVTGRRRPDRTA